MKRAYETLLVTLTALVGAWLAFNLLVFAYGQAPAAVGAALLRGTWGTSYGVGQVLFKATPILFTGVAVQMALRTGLFSIGAEGQLAVASLAAGVVGARFSPGVSPFVALPVLALVAAAAGAAWALPAAWLRTARGVHEVISTLLMNSPAAPLVGLAFAEGIGLPGTMRTADLPAGARIFKLDALVPAFAGSAASGAVFLAVAAAFVPSAFFARTRHGREMALVAGNAEACARAGIAVGRRRFQALVLSGAAAGLAALATVVGYKGYFESGVGSGAGFAGVAVAMLGRGRPLGLIGGALLFGTMQQGGLAINGLVPKEVMEVLQGVILVAVALAHVRVWEALRRRAPAEATREVEDRASGQGVPS